MQRLAWHTLQAVQRLAWHTLQSVLPSMRQRLAWHTLQAVLFSPLLSAQPVSPTPSILTVSAVAAPSLSTILPQGYDETVQTYSNGLNIAVSPKNYLSLWPLSLSCAICLSLSAECVKSANEKQQCMNGLREIHSYSGIPHSCVVYHSMQVKSSIQQAQRIL